MRPSDTEMTVSSVMCRDVRQWIDDERVEMNWLRRTAGLSIGLSKRKKDGKKTQERHYIKQLQWEETAIENAKKNDWKIRWCPENKQWTNTDWSFTPSTWNRTAAQQRTGNVKDDSESTVNLYLQSDTKTVMASSHRRHRQVLPASAMWTRH